MINQFIVKCSKTGDKESLTLVSFCLPCGHRFTNEGTPPLLLTMEQADFVITTLRQNTVSMEYRKYEYIPLHEKVIESIKTIMHQFLGMTHFHYVKEALKREYGSSLDHLDPIDVDDHGLYLEAGFKIVSYKMQDNEEGKIIYAPT